jgi:putative transposase
VHYINTTYRRTGTLWDSRYKSSLIQTETYLLACQRYIELNPVRAAMVDDPAHYRWTSYRSLFRAQLHHDAIRDIRLALNQSQPLGNSRFYAKIEAMTGQRREAKPRGRPRVRPDKSKALDAEQGKLPM